MTEQNNQESIKIEEEEIRIKPDFNRFVAIDIETTGLDPKSGEIIELGAVRFLNGDESETFHALIKPSKGLPERNRRLTGIDPAMLESGQDVCSTLTDFLEFIADDLLISHNAPFDTGFLRHHLKKCGIELFENPALCTLHLSAIVSPEAPTLQLVTLAKEWGIEVIDPHRALQDARMAGRLFNHLTDEIKKWPIEFIGHLALYRGKSLDPIFDLFDNLLEEENRDFASWRLEDCILDNIVNPEPDCSLPGFHSGPEDKNGTTQDDQTLRKLLTEAIDGEGLTLIDDSRPGLQPASRVLPVPEDSTDQQVIAVAGVGGVSEYLDSSGVCDFHDTACYLGSRDEYICINRAFDDDGRPSGWLELSPYERVILARWIAGTSTGRIARVNWWLLNNFSGLKGHLNSLSASGLECIGSEIDHAALCFAERARERAGRLPRVVVTQKHLCLKKENGSCDRMIGDVNCCIIEKASRFSHSARLAESEVVEIDALRRAFKLLAAGSGNEEYVKILESAADQLKSLLETCKRAIRTHRSSRSHDGGGPLTVDDESWNREELSELATELEVVGDRFERLSGEISSLEGLSESQRACSAVMKYLAGNIAMFRKSPTGWAASIEGAPARNPKRVTLRMAPVDISEVIQRVLGDVKKGTVAVDRNLKFSGSFERTLSQWGFPSTIQVKEISLHDPDIVLPEVYLPEDVTSPTIRSGRRYHWEKYMERTANLIRMLAETLGGRTVAAFSAHHELRRVREIIDGNPPRDCIVLAQYMDGTKSSLVREYLNDQRTLLLGGRNFLDGVDLRPAGFTALVLVKLPFVSPEEPIHRAALKQIESQGMDGMNAWLVPLAAETSNNWIDSLIAGPIPEDIDPGVSPGAVIILDPRATMNEWGDDFLGALNASPVHRLSFREMIAHLGEVNHG